MGSFAQGALVEQLASTATAGGTTTLTNASLTYQKFTGTQNQTIVLPDATTMVVGRKFQFDSRTTGILTINVDGGAFLTDVLPYTGKWLLLTDNSTAAGEWTVAIGDDVQAPLKLSQAPGTATASLHIAPSQVRAEDGSIKSIPPVDDTIPSFVASAINFQTGSTTGGTILRDGAAFSLPTTTIGQFRRVAFVYVGATNSVDTTFSAAAASQGALADPGTLFALLTGLPMGYLDLEATGATAFKTAGTTGNLIENRGIFRFASGSGGGGGAADTSFKIKSIVANSATIGEGSIILESGFELYLGSDLALDLLTDVRSDGVTSPSASTRYYLYVDLESLPAPTNVGTADRRVIVPTTGATGSFIVLADTPDAVSLARYLPLAAIKTDGSSDYTLYENVASIRSPTPTTFASPKVATLADAQSRSLFGLPGVSAGPLSDSLFPTPANAGYYFLATDSNNSGTAGGNLTQNGSPAFSSRGFFGRETVIGFDGVNDYLSSTSSHFNPNNATSFSLGFWVYSSNWADGTRRVYFSAGASNSTTAMSVQVEKNASNVLRVFVNSETAVTGLDNKFNLGDMWNAGTWHHVAIVRNGSTSMTLYLDGQLAAVNSSVTITQVPSNFKLHVGAKSDGASGGAFFFAGRMQELFYYLGALTELQVATIVAKRFENAQAGMQLSGGHVLDADSFPLASLTSKVAFYNLSSNFNDGSGNSATLTATGSGSPPAFTRLSVLGDLNAAARFSGTDQYLTNTTSPLLLTNPIANDITFGGWFAMDWAGASGALVCIGNGSAAQLDLRYNATSKTLSPDSGTTDVSTAGFLEGSGYSHITVRTRQGTCDFFVNGYFIGSCPNTLTSATPTLFNIGADRVGGNLAAMTLHDFYFSTVSLSDVEIAKTASSRFTSPSLLAAVAVQARTFSLKLSSEDGTSNRQIDQDSSFLIDNRLTKIYVNLQTVSPGEKCTIEAFDESSFPGSSGPVRVFDRTYTSTPPATIDHGLGTVPVAVHVLQLVSGSWVELGEENFVKKDATNLYTLNFGTLVPSVSVSNPVRIAAAASPFPAILNIGNVLENPMTTAGDIIYGGTGGDPTRLAASTAGFLLQTNGPGVAPTWVTPPSGVPDIELKNSAYNAVNGDLLLADTSGGAFTITLPSSPAVGNRVTIYDAQSTFGTNNLTVGRNGQNIAGSATDLICNVNGARVELIFAGGTAGWSVFV